MARPRAGRGPGVPLQAEHCSLLTFSPRSVCVTYGYEDTYETALIATVTMATFSSSTARRTLSAGSSSSAWWTFVHLLDGYGVHSCPESDPVSPRPLPSISQGCCFLLPSAGCPGRGPGVTQAPSPSLFCGQRGSKGLPGVARALRCQLMGQRALWGERYTYTHMHTRVRTWQEPS